jgi:MtN3 and saliva related transmembrane protein
MDPITILGLVAGALTSFSYIPQVVKSWKTKKTEDISLWMCILVFVGFCLWLVYGLLIKDIPLTVSNVAGLSLVSFILYLKVRYK